MSDIEQPCPIYHEIHAKLQSTCRKIEDLEKLINIQFAAHEKALETARSEMERRLAALNELRSEVLTDRNRFLSCDVYNEWKSAVDKAITKIETRSATWVTVIGIAFALLQIVIHYKWK
jgi:hypothetical protein